MARKLGGDRKVDLGGAKEFRESINRPTYDPDQETKEEVTIRPETEQEKLESGTLLEHKNSAEIDHPFGSITLKHLNLSLRSILSNFSINSDEELAIALATLFKDDIHVNGDINLDGSIYKNGEEYVEVLEPVIAVEYDDSTSVSTSSTSWVHLKDWSAVTLPGKCTVRYDMYCPLRNDGTTWGGGYFQLLYRIDGGSWQYVGDSGYVSVMEENSDSIQFYFNSLVLDFSDQPEEFDIEFRWNVKTYNGGTLRVNEGTETDGNTTPDSSAGQGQFWMHQIIHQISGVQGAQGDAGPAGPAEFEWQSDQTYNRDYICAYNGNLYISLQDYNTDKNPETETSWWDEYVKREFDEWHIVGAPGEPGFQNGWENYDGGYNPARFKKDAAGNVLVEVMVKSGTIGGEIFTLPEGYRPTHRLLNEGMTNSSTGRIDVFTDGRVAPQNGSNSWWAWYGVFNVGPSTALKGERGDPGVAIPWESGTTYPENAVVSYGDVLYVSLQDSNTGNTPDSSPSYWQEHTWTSVIWTDEAPIEEFMMSNTLYLEY